MQSVSITTSIVNSNTTQHYVIKFVTHGTAAHASAVLADDLNFHAFKYFYYFIIFCCLNA
jgi:hypothetical protein